MPVIIHFFHSYVDFYFENLKALGITELPWKLGSKYVGMKT